MSSKTIRAVLDTNVLISAIFWSGAPYKVFYLGTERRFTMVTSQPLIAEAKQILGGKFKAPPAKGRDLEKLLKTKGEIVVPEERLDVVTADPSDNKIIECAVAGHADYIVTGDRDLLDIKQYQNIKIVTPVKFLKLL